MKQLNFFLVASLVLFSQCHESSTALCNEVGIDGIVQRKFLMGFSTWLFGPEASDIDATYQFVLSKGDIYGEQIDDNIPWSAWMNDTALPNEYAANISQRANRKPANAKLLLQVSFLNDSRSDIMEDLDGSIPTHTALNDSEIEDAYVKHLDYLITKFSPTYLVLGMEVNELKRASEQRWSEYKLLMANVRQRLKNAYPELKISESVTLHQWYNPDVANPDAYIEDISNYVNQLDYAAISFYPFLKGLRTQNEFQGAFNFLHQQVTVPIAISETGHLAENLDIESFGTHIKSNECEQDTYLRTLFINANSHQYEFLVWFTFRDFDKLWESLPDDSKELAKIWRDTGLLDGNGNERMSYKTWAEILSR